MSKQQIYFDEDSLFAYKAAIALNNIGTTLLNRGCYSDALNSFQNAFALMNSSFEANNVKRSSSLSIFREEKQSASGSTESRSLAQDMLQKVSMKLAHSTKVMQQKSMHEHSDVVRPNILTAEKSSDSILDLIHLSPSAEECYVFRIDDDNVCDFDEATYVSDYLMEITIILNNMGTLYRCSASGVKSSKSKKLRKLIESGLTLCGAARRMLATMADAESHNDEITRQGLLNICILNNLINLSSGIEDIENAREYYIECEDIRSTILTIFSEDDDLCKGNLNDEKLDSRFHGGSARFHVTAARVA